uniref:non-specific serine/threonine protein kinase n=1 Tax=Salvator merianae TaxID=96440 RepID=A0A8D0B8J7_SALMN
EGKGNLLLQVHQTITSTPYVSVMDQYGYQIGKVIGHGSYGTVYEAYFTKQKTMVAIKIISKKKASEDYLTKFLPREIQDLIHRILRPASKRLNILEVLKVPWVLKFLAEKPTTEMKALEAICGPRQESFRPTLFTGCRKKRLQGHDNKVCA